jgi:transglutaminase-like putative cysteine protease
MLTEHERLGAQVNSMSCWDCQTGALMLVALAQRAGLQAQAQVGLYWHPDAASCARTTGEPDEGDGWRQEMHYWVILLVPGAGSFLLDANGEVRGEPRLQPLAPAPLGGARERWAGASGHYEPFGEGHEFHDPDELVPTVAQAWDERLAAGLRLMGSFSPAEPALGPTP